jgi:hypothetical protein
MVIEAIKTDRSSVRFLAALLSFYPLDHCYAFVFSPYVVDKDALWL